MTLNPIWLQNLSYSAQLDRMLIQALVGQEGIFTPLSMKVTPNSPADMSVDIASGNAFVQGDDTVNQGMYYVSSSGTETTSTIAAPSSGNHRYDTVCLAVQDPDASGPAGDNAVINVLTGTAVSTGSTRTPPTVPDTHLPLADIALTAGQSTITSSDITDRRTLCGGIDHIGTVQMWTGVGSLVPNGWGDCDGSVVSRTTYAELFEILGETYGSGDGTTTFALPDYRGRAPVGTGTGTYTGTKTPRNAGDGGGAETHSLSTAELSAHTHALNHSHTGTTGSNSGYHVHYLGHWIWVGNVSGGGFYMPAGGASNVGLVNTPSTGNNNLPHTHSFSTSSFTGSSQSAGSNSAHNNMMPFRASRFLIRKM